MATGIGIPIKLLQEAHGKVVTCEAFSGEKYQGKLVEVEDNMNCQMTSVTATYPNGNVTNIDNIYVRGSKIKCFILPDTMKSSWLFKRTSGGQAGCEGRGRGGFSRGQAGRGRGRGNPGGSSYGGSSYGGSSYGGSSYGSRGGRSRY